MAPVYQPDIVADVVYLATTTRRREIPVSFTTVLFSISTKLIPGIVDRAIRRLGYGGQLAEPADPLLPRNTTLFAPSDRASPVYGTFSAEARSGSLHVRLLCALAWLTGKNRRSIVASAVARRRQTEATAAGFTKAALPDSLSAAPKGESA